MMFTVYFEVEKNKAECIAADNRQYTPPVSQELAWMRLAIFYHKIASISPQSNSCKSPAQRGNSKGVRLCLPLVYSQLQGSI